MERDLASMPVRPDGRDTDDGEHTTTTNRDRRHLIVAVLAAIIGIAVLVVSLNNGSLVSFETLVGVLFLAVAVVRYRLAQAG